MKRRVVVTGMGAVTPLGNDLPSTWEGILAGRSGIGPLTRFDASGLTTQIAGQVEGFDAKQYIPPKEVKKMDLFIHYAVAAAKEAVADSGLEINESNQDRVGVFIGAGMGGLPAIEATLEKLKKGGLKKVSPFFIPMTIINLASGQVAIYTGARGPNQSAVSACASGAHSIGDAFKSIQRGDSDAMIAGGTEAAICSLGVAGFCASRALSTRNDDPQTASRPFDVNRDGFVMGEGAGIIVLEDLESAKARGARIYAEIVGYGSTGDAYHITSPPADASGASRCMTMALNDAGLNPEDVGYVNAHATSTMADALETVGVKAAFGAHARNLVMGSTKSMTGHLLGAAGGIESIFGIKALVDGVIPRTINVFDQDPACDLDCNPDAVREQALTAVVSNSFGFGGTNATLAFRAFTD